MNFERKYTRDQQAFRGVVRSWLQHNSPGPLNIPPDGRPLDQETQEKVKGFRRKLGEQGWLAPMWPREYGGGGLSTALSVVIQEEMQLLELPSMGDNYRWIPAMMVWGTEEQKSRYVLPALWGETITWQAFNEVQGGSDLASVRTQALFDGEYYHITGEKAFITGRFDPDYLWTLAVTDPNSPPRYNLGVLMVDADLTGVSIKTQRLLAGSERRVYFDNVIIPSDCLVGAPYQGWEIVQTILEGERGGYGFRVTEEGNVESIHRYLREEGERH